MCPKLKQIDSVAWINICQSTFVLDLVSQSRTNNVFDTQSK
uniref:Uncharacterized protein n=1 Tax=Anguilla anguilla TaxID=7936 RepID=A0A0E9THZ5_ANGAN